LPLHNTTLKGLRFLGRRHANKSEIGAAASADNDSVLGGKRSSRRPIRLQVPAELAVADDLRLLQIYHWRITFIPHRRQVATSRMTSTIIVPIRRAAKDVIEVLLTHYAKAVEHFMLQRLNHPFDMRL
jgi:hypothetical protein